MDSRIPDVARREFEADEEMVYLAISSYPHCLNVGGPCAECAAKIAVTALRETGRLRDIESG